MYICKKNRYLSYLLVQLFDKIIHSLKQLKFGQQTLYAIVFKIITPVIANFKFGHAQLNLCNELLYFGNF